MIYDNTQLPSRPEFHGCHEHYMEQVAMLEGVLYLNDSRSMTQNATWYALECIETKVILITGEDNYHWKSNKLIDGIIKEKVKSIILLPVLTNNQDYLHTLISGFMLHTNSMQEAVKVAYRLSNRGDTVLLSPGTKTHCYKARGREFKKHVLNLPY